MHVNNVDPADDRTRLLKEPHADGVKSLSSPCIKH